MITLKWNGKKFALESFIGTHHMKFEQMKEAAAHIHSQLPDAHMYVGYVLKAIETDNL